MWQWPYPTTTSKRQGLRLTSLIPLVALALLFLAACRGEATASGPASEIDGIYAKADPSTPQWWACRRCADYRPAGGVWKLELDHGVMNIRYDIISWRSRAQFELEGGRLLLTQDAVCPDEVGEYRWRLAGGELTLEPIRDVCSFGLRAQNLGNQAWQACPDQLETSGTTPEGCPVDIPPDSFTLTDGYLTVGVHPGIAAEFELPPGRIVDANPDNHKPPAGIEVLVSDDSIPYGRNLVIWKPGDAVEVEINDTVEAVGVQFHGDAAIGWARISFDEIEVWRGDTAAIWSSLGRFGGYVEVSGFETGIHTLRVEALGVDRRPITIAYFGLGKVEE